MFVFCAWNILRFAQVDAKGKSEPNIFSQSMVESKTSQKTNPSI